MRVDDAAQPPSPSSPPPAKAAGVAAIVMGATTHGHSAAFFFQKIQIDASEKLSVTKIMLMDHPHAPTASKAAPALPPHLHRATPRWPAGFPVLVGCTGGRLPIRNGVGAWAGLRLNPFAHSHTRTRAPSLEVARRPQPNHKHTTRNVALTLLSRRARTKRASTTAAAEQPASATRVAPPRSLVARGHH